MSKYIFLALAIWGFGVLLGLGGCARTPAPVLEPKVVTQQVQVAVPIACAAMTALGPEPTYPDTDAAIAAATGIGPAALLYAQGRKMRIQRLAEYLSARAACTF